MDAISYESFLAQKRLETPVRGLADVPMLHSSLFPYQRTVTDFLLRVGCGAAFLDTGLGKTFIQLEWARVVAEHTERPVLIFAPLAVAAQTVREGATFGIEAQVARDASQVKPGINVANYERLHLFDPSVFGGVVLDESSILKNFTGATTRALIAAFADTPFRLACSATPAPNDHMELGQHVEFLGIMAQIEMLSRWFINDSSDTGKWRLKGHAVQSFWDFVSSWARCASMPSDLGDRDDGFVLPPLDLHKHEVRADISIATDGALFRIPDTSATSIHREKRMTADARADAIADVVALEPGEPWIIWCDSDYEADALVSRIPGAVEVRGSMTVEQKEKRIEDFSAGRSRILVTKPSIAGFGLNWQHCARMAFVGLSFSYESFYQACRRCWRFGQERPVHVHVAMADTERAIWDVVARKKDDHDAMKAEMIAAMRRALNIQRPTVPYQPTQPMELPAWLAA